jgi:cytochrome c oxidase subunit IV
MSQSHSPSYKTYWIAWAVLLVITLAMVFIGHKPVLAGGMVLKAAIIAFLYMHLKFERMGLILTVVLGIFATTAVLVVLLVPDGMAM